MAKNKKGRPVNGATLSAVVSVHNEENRISECLSKLGFADELVVLLDRCTDGSKEISESYTSSIVEGSWEREGDRRNAAIAACSCTWILEVDADEHVTESLAEEILFVIDKSTFDWHEIPVDNYIGDKLVRYGWGGSFGKSAYPGLFRKGKKTWGSQRVHPKLFWKGQKGPRLKNRLIHFVDRNISEMIRRLDSYTSAKAQDMREEGDNGSYPKNLRRIFSRFLKCFVMRRGYREGAYGFLVAIFAGLYPIISQIKARNEEK